jgi:two-component system, chemotaxis family, chemotaxis protein CheY
MKYILIIDDSITIRSTIRLVIKNLGYSIAETENGQQALDKIKEIKDAGDEVILCITDINMPVMDGLTFISEFRKTDKFTPIIMLTSESQDEFIEKGVKLGATGWIIKPFQPNKLLDTIKHVIK